jgi:hypothetical protein
MLLADQSYEHLELASAPMRVNPLILHIFYEPKPLAPEDLSKSARRFWRGSFDVSGHWLSHLFSKSIAGA